MFADYNTMRRGRNERIAVTSEVLFDVEATPPPKKNVRNKT